MAKLTAHSLGVALLALKVSTNDANGQGWAGAPCPACGTKNGTVSLRVNVYTGEYKCFRCSSSSGGPSGIPLDVFVSSPTAPGLSVNGIQGKQGSDLPPLTDELVARYHRLLVDSPSVVQDLERKRGWTSETIKRLSIGWDGSHLWIPIRDVAGALVNARMYDPFKRTQIKSFHYRNPDGLRRTSVWVPFGVESFADSDEVWLFEGEPDGVLAAQGGLPVALVTGGSGTWSDELPGIIGDRRVVICYDMDVAGKRGGRAIKARLESHEKKVLHLVFELTEAGKHKDFSDAIIHEGRTVRWFRDLARMQWEGGQGAVTDPSKAPITVPLGGGVPGEYISVKAHVLGTHTVPVLVPQAVESNCRVNWTEEKCNACPAKKANGKLRAEVPPDSQALMLMAATPVARQNSAFRHTLGVPARCPLVTFSVPGMWQVQHIKVIPPMSERHGGDSTIRSAQLVAPSDGRPMPVRANQLYQFFGKIEPDVLTNEWTLLSSEARPAEDDIDSFHMDAELSSHLKSEFNPPAWTAESLDTSFRSEEKSLARHVTYIYGRDDLLRVVDLCYHSLLNFPFRGRQVQRGWLSVGILGDTRTGKSETMGAFCTYLGLGKYVMDPANTTYAGLVGGLQQVGKNDKAWTITWGLIPTNDRGMVILDEVSSLPVEDIGKMSGMRSSGIAEMTKIRSSSTPARTRLIMAGNPRGIGRMLSSYSTPVEGFMELIGAPEDVARFDIAMAVKQGLDKEVADTTLGPQPNPTIIDLRRALVKFAWSRRGDQASWEPGAEDMCSRAGAELARRYDHSIPLVEPSEQDLKVARIAVAAAARSFSVCEDNETVLVRACHVEFAVDTLRRAYDGELGYHEYSEFLGRRRLNRDEAIKAVMDLATDTARVCRGLLSIKKVNANSIGMALALDGNEARAFISRMAQSGAASFDNFSAHNSNMLWTPGFIVLLREMESNPPKLEERDIAF